MLIYSIVVSPLTFFISVCWPFLFVYSDANKKVNRRDLYNKAEMRDRHNHVRIPSLSY